MAISETYLDLRGLRCPLPVLRTRKALAGLPKGALLAISCTDPLAALDLAVLMTETGDLLESQDEKESYTIFHIRKA